MRARCDVKKCIHLPRRFEFQISNVSNYFGLPNILEEKKMNGTWQLEIAIARLTGRQVMMTPVGDGLYQRTIIIATVIRRIVLEW